VTQTAPPGSTEASDRDSPLLGGTRAGDPPVQVPPHTYPKARRGQLVAGPTAPTSLALSQRGWRMFTGCSAPADWLPVMTVTPSQRSGYEPAFLTARVPMPTREARAGDLVTLDYVHVSVALDTARRLAAVTAVNIDGSALVDVDRGDDWHLDPRIEPTDQAGPALYTANDLDRGHLVRRRDPVWGPPDIAERANFDSFAYPNAAPQAAGFNQSLQLWLGLEDHVLTYADTTDQHLTVFTGPVLATDDPTYRGIQIPRRFYKIAAWTSTALLDDDTAAGDSPTDDSPTDSSAVLSATAYVLDQTPQLDDIDLTTQRALREGQPPPLGPFRTFQVPVTDVTTLTGLNLGPLPAADRLPPAARTLQEETTTVGDGWLELQSPEDLRL